MAGIAEQIGLGRNSLYKAVQPEIKTQFDTVLRILHATELRIKVDPMSHH